MLFFLFQRNNTSISIVLSCGLTLQISFFCIYIIASPSSGTVTNHPQDDPSSIHSCTSIQSVRPTDDISYLELVDISDNCDDPTVVGNLLFLRKVQIKERNISV